MVAAWEGNKQDIDHTRYTQFYPLKHPLLPLSKPQYWAKWTNGLSHYGTSYALMCLRVVACPARFTSTHHHTPNARN